MNKNFRLVDKVLMIGIIVIALGAVYVISSEQRYAMICIIILQMLIFGIVWTIRNDIKSIFKKE